MLKKILSILVILLLFTGTSSASKATTQGVFAKEFVQALGHNDLDEQAAIDLLLRLSITPGIFQELKWQKDKLVDTKFIARIQASFQMLLKRTALKLKVPPPPTLELTIFEVPPAPQRIMFSSAEGDDDKCKRRPQTSPPPVTDLLLPPELEEIMSQPLPPGTIGVGTNINASSQTESK